ncbi:hypothetical protein ONE63_008521 [Megalurothrips usitatus]|uniref:Elongation of very long chain fatty acids protein n=1 Tax=Megalurothrips usitatus TaxID=439358 RepID=A0AAV7XLG1_9NEOP|nr:hypothetical protein ONE63_008521 [Megalurothrips usitatus]
MALLVKRGYDLYRYTFDELSDPRTSEWFMVGGLGPVLLLLAGYLYFVLSLGPRLMQHRKPFQLDKLMIVYNAVQVVCSLHVVREALLCCYTGQYNIFCQPVDYGTDEDSLRIARGFWFYYMLKIADLLDTVFFVLRKKSRQISFLHVYHHTGMILIGYFSTKFLAGGHGAFIGLANSLVHTVLYSHYLISILNPELGRHGWWKKYITQMQMVQFGFISLHSLQLLFQPSCAYPKFTVGVIVPQNAFLCLLFYDFYRKTYTKDWAKPAAPAAPVAAADKPALDAAAAAAAAAPNGVVVPSASGLVRPAAAEAEPSAPPQPFTPARSSAGLPAAPPDPRSSLPPGEARSTKLHEAPRSSAPGG